MEKKIIYFEKYGRKKIKWKRLDKKVAKKRNIMLCRKDKKERWQSGRLRRSWKPLSPQGFRGFESLSLRLKFNATSPFSASSESGVIYETTPLFASNWLLGFNKSPSTPNVQLNCNRNLAPQLGDDIVTKETYLIL